MRIELHDIMEGAVKMDASDIHMMEDSPPYLRVDGMLRPVRSGPLTHEDQVFYLKSMMPRQLEPELEESRGVDFAYHYGNEVRYRVNAYYERSRLKLVMRTIPMHIPPGGWWRPLHRRLFPPARTRRWELSGSPGACAPRRTHR